MPQLGPLEIAVVLLIALLVFGPNRLPELARQVGGVMRELRRIQQNIRADLHDMMQDESDGAAAPPTLPPKAEGADAIEGSGTPSGNGSGDPPGPSAPPVPPPSDAEAD